jgi:hypothetical protein
MGNSPRDTSRVNCVRTGPPFFVVTFLVLALAGCGGGDDGGATGTAPISIPVTAFAEAKAAFAEAQSSGMDLSRGPCIAQRLPGLPDWAADVAHDPRQPVDDQPRNQCTSFREGQTHHFVELTPDGRLIRAQ